jgi:hypothetical protein
LVRDAGYRRELETARSLNISRKRLLGWEPTDVHTYTYDADGRVESVKVTRESEWDDESREEMLALAEYESEICACGFHSTLTKNKSNHFGFELDTCEVCAGREQYARMQAKDDAEEEKKLEKSPPETPRPADGRRVFMRMKPAGLVAE